VLFPGLARRDFAGADGVSIETLLVAPDLPLVLLQWTGTGATTAPITVELTLAPPKKGRPDVDRAAAGVAVHAGERGLAVGVVPAPRGIDVEDLHGGAVRVTVTPSPSGAITLLLAGGTAEEARRAFAAGAHPAGHAVRAAAGPLDYGLSCATGIGAIDDGVAWARVRLAGLRATTPDAGEMDAADHARLLLLQGLAAIAVGDREVSDLAGERLKAIRSSGDVPSAEAALLAARHASAFGDAARASELARFWTDGVAVGRAGAIDRDRAALWQLAASALSEGLLHAAPDALIRALRSYAAEGAAASPALPRAGAGSRPLPMVEGASRPLPMVEGASRPLPEEESASRPAEWARWLKHVFEGNPSLPAPASARPAVGALRRAMGLFPVDPDSAWNEWRRAVEAGLVDGPAGPATWDDDGNDPLTTEILLALVHGLLGIAPDAPSGRIRLAPRMPGHLASFAVRGVTLGDASIRLAYRRSGSTRVFELEPEHGGVPPLVVLEPSMEGRVSHVRIDGAPADLDSRPHGGRTIVPVQLPLDAPRTVEITTG
jgi:hypothetical protein